MKYDIDYFINKFEAIPDENWGINNFVLGNKCCAYGHCGVVFNTGETLESKALEEINKLLPNYGFLGHFTRINDGLNHDYKQETPKTRILAALNDIKNNSCNSIKIKV